MEAEIKNYKKRPDPFDPSYDKENRLLEASDATRSVIYIYDGLGRRVERLDRPTGGELSATRYVYDGWRVMEELAWAPATSTWTVASSYTCGTDLSGTPEGAGGIGGLLALSKPIGTTWTTASYVYDGNGNVTHLVDGSGATVARYTYDPFGEHLTATGAWADVNTVQFSSKERDAFTGFYYYGLRYYNPSVGRWLNRDPIHERGGINLYVLAFNDSVNYWDYLGLSLDPCRCAILLDRIVAYNERLALIRNARAVLDERHPEVMDFIRIGVRNTNDIRSLLLNKINNSPNPIISTFDMDNADAAINATIFITRIDMPALTAVTGIVGASQNGLQLGQDLNNSDPAAMLTATKAVFDVGSNAFGAILANEVRAVFGRPGPGIVAGASVALASNGISRVIGAGRDDYSYKSAVNYLNDFLSAQKEEYRLQEVDLKAVIDSDMLERRQLGCE